MTDFPEKSIGLCLSGGGFRASFYHLGVLRYLAETDQLRNVCAISSVSGGSIIAAYLACRWKTLREKNFSLKAYMDEVYTPFIQRVTHTNFRNLWLLLCLMFSPFLLWWPNHTWISLWSWLFDRLLYDNNKGKMCSLPDDLDLVINATNLHSARAYRFARVYRGDDEDNYPVCPDEHSISLAQAVTASSAHFPSYIRFGEGSALWFMDGGVFDNTGLDWYLNWSPKRRPEAACNPKFLLVSDASPELRAWQWNWRRFIPFVRMAPIIGRVSGILQEQTRRTRKDRFIQLVRDFKTVAGIIISIDQVPRELDELKDAVGKDDLKTYGLPKNLVERVRAIRTDLDNFLPDEASLLAFHGYSLAHVYMRIFQEETRIGGRTPYVEEKPVWEFDLSSAKEAYYLDRLKHSDARFYWRRRQL